MWLRCAAWLLLSFQDQKNSDQMFELADKALDQARDFYNKKEFFDCIGEAERARGMYQALVELYDTQGKSARRQECEEKVKQCNQLIKLANDGRKGAPSSVPPSEDPPKKIVDPPKDAPKPPEPVKEPEAPPADRPTAVEEFGKVLAGTADPTDPVKMIALLRDLATIAKSKSPWQPYARVAWTIASRLVDGSWTLAPEDKPLFKEYSEKLLGPKVDHRLATLHLIKGAELAESNVLRWRLFRMLALAHARITLASPDSPLHLELLSKGRTLDIVQDEKECWSTREGESIAACKTPEDFKNAPKVRETIRDVYRLIVVFEALCKSGPEDAKELLSECKGACGAAEPAAAKLVAGIKSALEGKKICHACGGTHRKKCSGKCDDNGMLTAACARCQGHGFGMFSGRKLECLAQPPAGKRWENGHTYKVPCAKCGAKGYEECRFCPAAWSGAALKDGLKSDPCDGCQGSGWLIADMKLPCFQCFASGKRTAVTAKK